MYHAIIEVGYIKYLCYKLFIVYPETQSWCLDCIFLMTLSQGSSTFPFGEVEAGLKTEMMDRESFWYYLIRPPLLTHLWHIEILGWIEALLVTGTERPYSVAINCALWSSQGLVPTCLFKTVSRGSSHKTIFPAALPRCQSHPGPQEVREGLALTMSQRKLVSQ